MGKKPLGPQLEAALAKAGAFSSQLEIAQRELGKLREQVKITAETVNIKDQKIELLTKAKETLQEHKDQNVELRVENRILREDRDAMRELLAGRQRG